MIYGTKNHALRGATQVRRLMPSISSRYGDFSRYPVPVTGDFRLRILSKDFTLLLTGPFTRYSKIGFHQPRLAVYRKF